MFRNTRIATMLLGIIAVFFTFQLLVGGMGFVALRQTNQDVGQLYRLSSQQVNAVNSAALSLVAARTDLSLSLIHIFPWNPPGWRAMRCRAVLVGARRMGMSGADTPLSEKSPATATGMQK